MRRDRSRWLFCIQSRAAIPSQRALRRERTARRRDCSCESSDIDIKRRARRDREPRLVANAQIIVGSTARIAQAGAQDQGRPCVGVFRGCSSAPHAN